MTGEKTARLGIISAYPDEDWHAQRIVAAARGHVRVADVEVLSPLDFAAEAGCVPGPGSGKDLPRLAIRIAGHDYARFDALLTPRALGDEGDHELQLELYRTLAEEGVLFINDVRALTLAIDKFKTSWVLAKADVPTPRALVTQQAADVLPALHALGGRVVAKPLYGSLGEGVELYDGSGGEAELQRLHARLRRRKALYLQAYVDGGRRDVRAFVVGDRVECAIARVAPPGEFRTNVHLGGHPERTQLSPEVERVAVAAARALGLDYAGVDLMEGVDGRAASPTVLEVNGTPLFRGIYEATGCDMGVPIVEHVLARIDERRRPGRGRRQAGSKQGAHTWQKRKEA